MNDGGNRPPTLRRPEPLNQTHQVDAFRCGIDNLDNWLKRRARANQASGASRTFVVCRGQAVVGYYALAAGSIDHDQAPGRIRRNMPAPIPAIVLGRLAVAASEQASGLGHALVRDALARVQAAAKQIGAAAILAHAVNERAKDFYLSCGFIESPLDPLTLMARVKDVTAELEASRGASRKETRFLVR